MEVGMLPWHHMQVPEIKTHANFLLANNAFVHTFFSHTIYDDLTAYLEAVHKPKKMT